jgi:lipid-A-disaccharide synthase
MLVAAEASGDALGAGLARALKRRLGEDGVRFVGVGGAQMAREGVQSPFDIRQLSVLGLVEGLMAYPRVKARVADTLALAERERPDIAVLIDSWGFTLRVAQGLKAARPDLPVVKYVAPQVWASRPGRAKTLAASVDHLMSIHAFDAPYFERVGLATTFVGNSALSRDFSGADALRFRASIGAEADDPVLLVLPGSRPSEIARLAAPFEVATNLLGRRYARLRVAVPVAATVAAQVKTVIAGWRFPVHVIEGEAAKRDAMKGATVALACSGTVTTELAMAGCPMVVAYRIGPLTYVMLRLLVSTRYITLFNIAAGAAVAPEFIQGDCTGAKLAEALAQRIDDADLRARQVAAQTAALDRMGRGAGDPADKAAEVVLSLLPAHSAPGEPSHPASPPAEGEP